VVKGDKGTVVVRDSELSESAESPVAAQT